MIITNTVLLITGFTYGLYLLLFDGKGHPIIVAYLREFTVIAGIINFVEKQKMLSVLMFILTIFFFLFGISCNFNPGNSSCS